MILTINCGSSSLKYKLYDRDLASIAASGIVAKINEPGSYADHCIGERKLRISREIPDHRTAFALMMENLLSSDYGAISDAAEITAIGHRAVHGGAAFMHSAVVDDHVMTELEACANFAPLHNPCNIAGIKAAQRLFPGIPNVVVFDTAFHQTMPPEAYIYALPYELATEHGIRRYGFHGTSCRYVSQAAAEILNRPMDDLAMIVCHLGSGASIDAIKGGKSIDTSMGFGTFCGVPMGTRTGDVDPAILFYLVKTMGKSLEEVEEICYKKSGLLGLSGLSNDMREISEAARAGNARCKLAEDVFTYQVRKMIGAYAAAMGGLDVLVFTAGIGENSAEVRSRICEGLGFLGVGIDEAANAAARNGDPVISAAEARVATLVVPTDEERMIAIDTLRLTAALQPKNISIAAQ